MTIYLAITGHRRMTKGQAEWARSKMARFMQRAMTKGDVTAISGMAIGVDQWWAEIALELGVPLHAYLPFELQHGWMLGKTRLPIHEYSWPESVLDHYLELLQGADRITDCSDTFVGKWKTPGALMNHRNKRMVGDCDYLGGVWMVMKGGTANCLQYGIHMERRIYSMNPKEEKCGWDILKTDDDMKLVIE